jgi:hypothetical protein
MTIHLSTIRKWFRAGTVTAALGFALVQAPGFAQVSPQGQWFYVEYTAGKQTANGPQPSLPNAYKQGGFRIDYVAIQCIGCTQAWHIQLYTRVINTPVVHSTGFMLIPTIVGGVNYAATSLPASIYVEQGSSWELLFDSGGATTTVVPNGVYVEISGHMEAVGPVSGSLRFKTKEAPALPVFESAGAAGFAAPAAQAARSVFERGLQSPRRFLSMATRAKAFDRNINRHA